MLEEYGEVIKHASLENYNTYGIKTSCKYLVKPFNAECLKELVKYLNENNIKYIVLGKGSNVILPDSEFNGVIISLEKLNKITINGCIVTAFAGCLLARLVKETVEESLKGLEHLVIPGTLGGALFGNASFLKDITIYNYVVEVVVLRNNEFVTLKKEDIKLSYRKTSFQNSNDIIVSATFKLEKGKKEELEELIEIDRLKRLNTQPLKYKNAGSVFKNPEGTSAGKLIDDANLKGYKVGGAEVSQVHANFIINTNNATSSDIIKLIKEIKKIIKEKYNIELELEQRVIEWD